MYIYLMRVKLVLFLIILLLHVYILTIPVYLSCVLYVFISYSAAVKPEFPSGDQ